MFFDQPDAEAIRDAVVKLLDREWNQAVLHAHAATFSEERFATRMQGVVEEELAAR